VTFTGDIGKQASQATLDCHVANGSATVESGVGYQLPGWLVDVVNGVLAQFSKYRIEREGKLIPGAGGELFNVSEDIPQHCAGVGKAATPAAT
jgi:hypothetical protein